MREQCQPIFRQARRDVHDAIPELVGRTNTLADTEHAPPVHDASPEATLGHDTLVHDTLGHDTLGHDTLGHDTPEHDTPRRDPPRERSRARSRRRSCDVRTRNTRPVSTDSDRTPDAIDARSERAMSRATSAARNVHRQPSPRPDSDDEPITREPSPAARQVNRNWWRGRGKARGRGTRSKKPRGRAAAVPLDNETNSSGSETPAPPKKTVERTQKLVTPEKSPTKQTEPTSLSPALGMMGALRKPTLLVSPASSSAAAPPKSFGSDASLPTLSASLGRASMEASPKKKGRGRPRKHDKDKSASSPDPFRSLPSGENKQISTPVPASFLQYRGPPGEVGSDSDLALSRSSSSSSAWSQSCSSCTHYDDDNASEHSCSMTSSDGSSYNETLESTAEGSGPEPRRTRPRASRGLSTPTKGRGTRSTSKTPVKSSQTMDIPLEPLQLVWAKCRGYPWYPALIIDPKIPKGFIYNGVPLPVPPQDVLNLKKNHSHEPILYLVLFFDAKRTWQWLPPNKLEPLGIEKSLDQAKLVESRKPTDRKAVKKAYGDAMQFRKQVDGDDK